MLNWFKEWQKHGDGYNPDAKGAQDGKEHWARKSIRESVLADPFSEATRRTRRSLLALSVASLLVNAGYQVGLIRYAGKTMDESEFASLLALLSIGVVYFLVTFVVSAGYEYSRWRLSGNIDVQRRTLDWVQAINDMAWKVSQHIDHESSNVKSSNLTKFAKEVNQELPGINTRVRRTANHYVSTSRIQMFRILLLDFALPLLVAFLALSKVFGLVWPMIVKIASA